MSRSFLTSPSVPTPTAADHAATKAYIDGLMDEVWSSRAGNVSGHAGSTAPSGALLMYGQAISRTTYAILFAVIGTAFGSGDGVTTFNVPDARGRVWAGLDNMGGSDAGRLSWANTMGTASGAERHQLVTGEAAQKAVSTGTESVDHGHLGWHQNDSIGMAAGGPGYLNAFSTSYGPNTGTQGRGAAHTHAILGSSAASAHNNMQPTILGNYIIWTGNRP